MRKGGEGGRGGTDALVRMTKGPRRGMAATAWPPSSGKTSAALMAKQTGAKWNRLSNGLMAPSPWRSIWIMTTRLASTRMASDCIAKPVHENIISP